MPYTASQSGRALGRNDCHVRRVFVRAGAHNSRQRLHFYLEEALRLISLPGENEGRIYHFRRLSLLGVPASAPRTVWIDRLQQTLLAQSRYAVHASDPRSAASDAVFFYHEDEAFELMLRASLAAHAPAAWFWQSAFGVDAAAPRAQRIAAIVEQIRSRRAPQHTAAILLSALHSQSPATLLAALPTAIAQDWLRTLEISGVAPPELRETALPEDLRSQLLSVAEDLGWTDDRTLWLATQMILSLAPPSETAATSVKKARATLQRLALQNARPFTAKTAPRALFFDDEAHAGPAPAGTAAMTAATHPPSGATLSPAAAQCTVSLARSQTELPQGDVTSFAGLYFLLPALRHLGVGEALIACPALVDSGFIGYLFRAVAEHAGAAIHDPVLSVVAAQVASSPTFVLDDGALSTLANVVPRNFRAPSAALTAAGFLRLWTLAVRRWCWHAAGISVRDIITRPGRIWLTRSDVDITFAFSAIDLRIRRPGLDVDPGWTPWLGRFGLVVRFHYRDRGDGPC